MANKKIRGITIEIGGDTTNLGKALEDSEKKSRSLQTELTEINKALKFDPSNIELLAQKQTVLTQNIEETAKKLDTLKEAEKQVIAQFERGEVAEDQVRALQREIIKTEGVLGSMKTELSNVDNETDDLAKSFKDVGDASDDANDGFTIMKGALADLTANAIQGAINSVSNFVSSLFELSEATEEYRVMQNKLSGSAETFGYSVDFANEKYKQFYGYLGDDQMSTNAITNLMGLGTSTESLSKLAEGAISVWTAYGDSIPIESLTESINETAQVGKVTGTLADALNWAGISEDDFNAKLEKTTSTQERADMIAQVLNDTYGESKEKYDELSGSIVEANKAELDLKDTQAELGKTMEPVNTAITELKNKALEKILPVVQSVAEGFLDLLTRLKENPGAMQALTAVVTVLATSFTILAGALAIQGIISGVTKAIALLNTTLLTNPIVLIISAIAGLVAGFIYLWNNCEAFRNFWIELWNNIVSIVSTVVTSIGEFFTNLWTDIVAVWSLVTTWFNENIIIPLTTFFSNLWLTISGFFSQLWADIVTIFTPAVEWFSALFNSIAETISSVIAVIVGLASGCWEVIKAVFAIVAEWFNNNVITPVSNFFSKMWEKITSLASSAWRKISGVFSVVAGWFNRTIITPVSNFFSGMWNKLRNGASGAWEGIKGVFSSVTSWFSEKFSSAWSAVKKVFSTGGKVFDGIKEGIASNFKTVVNAIIGGINKVISVPFGAINGALNTVRNVSIAGLTPFSGLPTISTPQIPLLWRGGILKKGQTGFLEGDGAEAVVPLEKETGWINRIAQKMNELQETPNRDIALSHKMDEMIQTIRKLKSTIVLDTGTLVGETINQIDEQLGNNYSLRERRI